MKTIELAATSPEVSELLRQAADEDLVVRLPDGSEYLLAAIDESDAEVIATRRNLRLMEYLEMRAQQPRTIPLAEVKRQLGIG
ncbi:MAG TPA: hypothetical protein VJ783_26280 [Pirellulales bacterium]|nr:hypothetical protein [Pirellulales bacterium]